MDNIFKGIVCLTSEQFAELSAHGTLTVGDVTVEYDPDNTLYLTSDDVEAGGTGGSGIADLSVSVDDNYKMKFKLLGTNGGVVGSEKEIDLPLETMVVGGTYNNSSKEIELTLQNGNKVKIPVSNLVGGLVPATRKINGRSLNEDINLTAEDLGISLEGEPTIQANDGILTIQKNGTNVGTFTANQAGNSTINIEIPVDSVNGKTGVVELPIYEKTSKETFTFCNNNTLKPGVYLLKGGAEVRYGHSGYESSYSFRLTTGSILIYQRTQDWNASGGFGQGTFQAFDGSDIYTGNTNYYSSNCSHFPMPAKYTSDGKPMLNRVPKIVDSNGTMQWIEPEYYTKEQINARTINSKPLSSNITLTASDISATIAESSETVQTSIDTIMLGLQQIVGYTVNNKAISTNPTITASDVGALPSDTFVPTKVSDLTNDSKFTSESTVNNKLASYVKTSTTINGKPLSSNVTLNASDVGALASTTKVPTGTAADKNYTTTMDNSDNLPTAAAVQTYVTSRGYVTSSGSVASATNASNAIYATNATNDEGGRNIYETYAKKSDLGTQAVFTLSGTTLTIVPK